MFAESQKFLKDLVFGSWQTLGKQKMFAKCLPRCLTGGFTLFLKTIPLRQTLYLTVAIYKNTKML
ncbi:MAG: hypothetical protein AAB757_01660 [Patescibacteria group bacterium]